MFALLCRDADVIFRWEGDRHTLTHSHTHTQAAEQSQGKRLREQEVPFQAPPHLSLHPRPAKAEQKQRKNISAFCLWQASTHKKNIQGKKKVRGQRKGDKSETTNFALGLGVLGRGLHPLLRAQPPPLVHNAPPVGAGRLRPVLPAAVLFLPGGVEHQRVHEEGALAHQALPG